MFSKNNTYLFPHVSSSSLDHHHHPRSSSSSSVVDLNGVEIFLHHHHPDIFSGHYNNVPVADTLLNQDDVVLNGDPTATGSVFQRKQTAKKDRHSKIFTSQGPRDRRVRLSIGIARKFFDLQEMLGFDKPSKTLDWLLTKSKAAIKELVQMKEKGGGHNKSGSECELIISSAIDGEAFEYGADSKGKSGNKNVKGASSSSLAKESRAKARARARERTREKMCIKQLKNGGENAACSELNPFNIPFHCKNNQLGVFQLSAGSSSNNQLGNREAMFHCPLNNNEAAGAHQQDLIQESVLIKRKTKNVPSFFGFQQNVFVSRDSSSNYGVPFANGAHENWDVCSFTSQSNLCAILDQHKFMNSSSNM